jgi:hypothetical protein
MRTLNSSHYRSAEGRAFSFSFRDASKEKATGTFGQTVQRAKKPSPISHDNQHEPLDSSASSSHVVIDSETERDNEIYWPIEDDWDENFFEDGEQKSLLLKWIPDTKPKARKPHIGVSRWTGGGNLKSIREQNQWLETKLFLIYGISIVIQSRQAFVLSQSLSVKISTTEYLKRCSFFKNRFILTPPIGSLNVF